jgi:ribonuclease HII
MRSEKKLSLRRARKSIPAPRSRRSLQIVGIDEVGRGPVAGPVAVAAFFLIGKITPPKRNGKPVPLCDSKKLSRREREIWFAHIAALRQAGVCDYAVTMISASVIDRIGISKAIARALKGSLYKVAPPNPRLAVILDGGLSAPREYANQETHIKGDEKYPAIALASIAAKVTRDRYMIRQAKKFPQYGFENHVGYGTRAHYLAIKTAGLSPLHRRSFLKSLVAASVVSP